MGMMGPTVPGVRWEGGPSAIIPDTGEYFRLSCEHQPTRISLRAQEGPMPLELWTQELAS